MKTRKRKYLMPVVICILILAIAIIGLRWGVIFQRGNPLPYASKMFTLNDSHPYTRVFDDKDIYMIRNNVDGIARAELIKHIENTYEVTFIEQGGSSYLFESDEQAILFDSEIYWSSYLIFELDATWEL